MTEGTFGRDLLKRSSERREKDTLQSCVFFQGTISINKELVLELRLT